MYTLTLTQADIDAIGMVGSRYFWSEALEDVFGMDPGTQDIAESHAWTLARAFELDTVGNHSPFPMLSPRSELYEKLTKFWEEIV